MVDSSGAGSPPSTARIEPDRAGVRFGAYARLAKFDFFDYYLSIVVVWTLLPVTERLAGDNLIVLLLFVLGEVGVVAAVVVFDDVTGYLDGSDHANYLGEHSGRRKLHRKPLLTGELTVPQARRAGLLALCWGVVLWSAAASAAPHRPVWTLLLIAGTILASVQYSWGAKLSYHGFGEFLIAGAPTAIVLIPYALVTGELTGLVTVEALLFGLWQILVSAYSNTNDISGDASVGRSTVAVRASRRGNLFFIAGLTVLDLALIVGSAAAGWTPWWFAPALIPVIALRLRQFAGFARSGNALEARLRGVRIFRVGVALLLVVNIANLGL